MHRLLQLPGLPIIISGIFVRIDTNKRNRFSFNNEFFAIPSSNSIRFIKYSCSTFIKSLILFMLSSGLEKISFFNSSFFIFSNKSQPNFSSVLLFIICNNIFSKTLLKLFLTISSSNRE